jgi:hypothetical protein
VKQISFIKTSGDVNSIYHVEGAAVHLVALDGAQENDLGGKNPTG